MLGYPGYDLFPDKQVSSCDLLLLDGIEQVTRDVGQEETINYNTPHIWNILGKDQVAGAQHWVIRYKDKIYCPTIGTMNYQEYKDKYVAYVLQTFAAKSNI